MESVVHHKDIPYLPQAELRQTLDLYESINHLHNSPLLVYIHGGAWVDRDKKDYLNIGRYYSSVGFSVAVINYRLSPKKKNSFQHPQHTLDCAAAIHWLKKNSKSYHYSPSKIFLFGHSAGAHMSSLLILDPSYLGHYSETIEDSIKGIIGIEGIYDLIQLDKDWPNYKDYFIEFAFGNDKNQWKQASPQNLFNDQAKKVKVMIIHSPEDELVNSIQSERFVEHLHNNGIQVEYVSNNIKGKHFNVVEFIGSEIDCVSNHIIQFVNEK